MLLLFGPISALALVQILPRHLNFRPVNTLSLAFEPLKHAAQVPLKATFRTMA